MIEELFGIPILFIRSQKVALDRTVAKFYGVSTKELNRAVRGNPERFPPNFMFQLTTEEARAANHTRSRPYAFTEQGVLMLSSVLNSERADQVNVELMQTLVRLWETPASNAELTRRVDALEYDCKVFREVIRKPMKRAVPRRKEIGFLANSVKR
jgi:hypothetical protein